MDKIRILAGLAALTIAVLTVQFPIQASLAGITYHLTLRKEDVPG